MLGHSWTVRRLGALAVAPLVVLAVNAGFAPGAGAQVPHASLPLVESFTASPATVSDKGGTVTLKAKLKYAETCTLSVSPSVTGLPDKNFSCSSGSFSKPFTIKKDTTSSSRTYTFSLSVKNSEGTVKASNAVIREGAAPPPITFGVTSLGFGKVGVGVSSPNVEVQVTNNSSAPQDLGTFTILGSNAYDFGLVSNDCQGVVLSPTGGCSFAVDFIPTSSGKRVATFELLDQSWGTTGTDALLPVSGTGVFSEISISASSSFYHGGTINFGDEGVDTSTSPLYITVTDASATVPLRIASIGVSGPNSADFGAYAGNCQADGPVVIDPGNSCQFTVDFVPTGSGPRSAQIDVNANVSGGVLTIPESGTGEFATLTLDEPPGTPITTIPFGDTSGGASVNVTVTNTSSNVFLIFNGPTGVYGQNVPDFTWADDSCAYEGAELAPSQSCTFTVSFTPQVENVDYFATFSLFDNTATASQTLALSGDETST
ncbi:MAG: choice-of-anchor D domain-containing protein [Acidimicrobiales bacterium]|jgi:hypothetical protein